MTIIEKMAAKMHEVWEDGADLDRIARAARDALVLGLTDEQVYALSRVNDPFDCEHQWHLRIVRENRAALIEATEVDG